MTEVEIRPAGPKDRDLLDAFLRALSADSAYLRFQTGIGTAPPDSLVRGLLPCRPGAGALLAEVDGVTVGHGMWVCPAPGRPADIALVVADDHQRRGVGTALARELIAEVAAHGIDRIEIFSTAGNAAVARMVARHAPGAVRVPDGATVTYTFATPRAARPAIASVA